MHAWRNADGTYTLRNEGISPETYLARKRIKQLGGCYHIRTWKVPAEALGPLKAKRILGVLLDAYCHTPPEFCYVTEAEVTAGFVHAPFCARCDSRSAKDVAIIECFGEPPEAWRDWQAYQGVWTDKL